jgi:hypothetical protein
MARKTEVYDRFGRRVLASEPKLDGTVMLYDKKDGNVYYNGPIKDVETFIDEQVAKGEFNVRET